MVKLNRFTMPVFAGNASQTQTSVFGTMKTSPQYTTNVAASIGTTAYSNGWADAIEIGYAPFMEDMNTLQRAITYQIAYNQQQGIPEWDSDTEYYIGSLAKLNTAGGSQIYSSLVNNNVGNLLSDATKWKLLLDTANSYVTTDTTQTITGTKTFSASPIVPTATSGDSSAKAASTEFVTTADGNLQTQINSKQDIITGGASTITSSNLATGRALASDSNGKVIVSSTTASELNYVHGVTSAIQTQLNNKISAEISRQSKGYCKFSNGLIIQWGRKAYASPDPQSVSFPTNFTSTNYKVVGTYHRNADVGSSREHISIATQNIGNFTFYMANASDLEVNWIAIGY